MRIKILEIILNMYVKPDVVVSEIKKLFDDARIKNGWQSHNIHRF